MISRMSLDGEQESASNASDSSKGNWLQVRKGLLSHNVTRGFKTLRDMHSLNIVPFGNLELVCNLGGACALASEARDKTLGRVGGLGTPEFLQCHCASPRCHRPAKQLAE